jgi:alkylation response protein AidB-like acyl-CoA dehydrogenase
MKALEITQFRVVSAYDKAKGAGKPDPLSSVLKVKGTELLQATSELAVDVSGPMATPIWAEELAAMNEADDMLEASSAGTAGYLMLRAASIYGGTNEIQKNILTKAVLGL